MAMEIDWDVVEGSEIRDKDGELQIIRPVMVTGMEQDCSDGNPLALLQALGAPGMPIKGTAHSVEFPYAFLEERDVQSIGAVDACRVMLVYVKRLLDDGDHTASSTWSMTDDSQGSFVQTYATADGSKAIRMWYKPGEAASIPTNDDRNPPDGCQPRTVALRRYRGYRVITATAVLRGDDWSTWKADVRASAFKINADAWGTSARGHWLFLGPRTRFIEPRRRIVHVSLSFLEDPNGHYPIGAWINERGAHPADCVTEANLRGSGPPPVNTIRRDNGLVIASVQGEANFTDLFAFTPDL